MEFSELSNLKCPIQRAFLMMKSSGNLENLIFTELSWNTLCCQLHTELQNISFCHWTAFRESFTKYIYTLVNTCHRRQITLWPHTLPLDIKQHLIWSADAAQTVGKFIGTPRPSLACRVDFCSYASGVQYDHDASLSTTVGGLLRFIECGLEFDHKLMHSNAGPGGGPDIWLLGKKDSSISPNN